MKKPKFKKGDIVQHILTKEKVLIVKVIHYIEKKDAGDMWTFSKDFEYGAFTGTYKVKMTDYSTMVFSEWELEPSKKEENYNFDDDFSVPLRKFIGGNN